MEFEIRAATGLRRSEFPVELVIKHSNSQHVTGMTIHDLAKLTASVQAVEIKDGWITDEYGREIDAR